MSWVLGRGGGLQIGRVYMCRASARASSLDNGVRALVFVSGNCRLSLGVDGQGWTKRKGEFGGRLRTFTENTPSSPSSSFMKRNPGCSRAVHPLASSLCTYAHAPSLSLCPPHESGGGGTLQSHIKLPYLTSTHHASLPTHTPPTYNPYLTHLTGQIQIHVHTHHPSGAKRNLRRVRIQVRA